jgi:hypothetical protein
MLSSGGFHALFPFLVLFFAAIVRRYREYPERNKKAKGTSAVNLMDNEALKIPKKKKLVSLSVESEGQVIASVFLQLQSDQHHGEETPEDIFNTPDTFLVVLNEDPQEPRFYHLERVIQVEYHEDPVEDSVEEDTTDLACKLTLRDGSEVLGNIREFLPPEHRRLYDYINKTEKRFVKLYESVDQVILVNKDHIVRISPL